MVLLLSGRDDGGQIVQSRRRPAVWPSGAGWGTSSHFHSSRLFLSTLPRCSLLLSIFPTFLTQRHRIIVDGALASRAWSWQCRHSCRQRWSRLILRRRWAAMMA